MDRRDFVFEAHLVDEVLNFTATVHFWPFLRSFFPKHTASFAHTIYKSFGIVAGPDFPRVRSLTPIEERMPVLEWPMPGRKIGRCLLIFLSLDTLFLQHALAGTRRDPEPTTTCEFQTSLFLAFLVIKFVFHALDGISQNKTVVHLDPPLLDGIVDLRF